VPAFALCASSIAAASYMFRPGDAPDHRTQPNITDAVLVAAQLYSVDDTLKQDAGFVRQIAQAIPGLPRGGQNITMTVRDFEALIDVSGNGGFYAYPGSLTSPETPLPVTWIVMARVFTLSPAAIGALRNASAHLQPSFGQSAPSFRPLQPRDQRKVFHRFVSIGRQYVSSQGECRPSGHVAY